MKTDRKPAIQRGFWNSVWRGAAAPLTLFSSYSAPALIEPQLNPMYRPADSAGDALRGDVRRIGADFKRSLPKFDGSQ